VRDTCIDIALASVIGMNAESLSQLSVPDVACATILAALQIRRTLSAHEALHIARALQQNRENNSSASTSTNDSKQNSSNSGVEPVIDLANALLTFVYVL
jgi:hypothetical protein